MLSRSIFKAFTRGAGAPRIILLAATILALRAPVWAKGTVASAALGQPDFTHSPANFPDAASFNVGSNYVSTAVDKSSTPNHLYLTDLGNNRVLGYTSVAALMNGAPADLVIGQPDFFSTNCNSSSTDGAANLCQPRGVAVDSNGAVYVADTSNHRVLVFANPFVIKANTGRSAGFSAFMVLGQAGDFTSTGCNVYGSLPSPSTLCSPDGVALDSANNLYVADYSNNRVLEFNDPAGTGSLTADLVIGQPSFTANAANQGGTASRTTLYGPVAVAVDTNNNLYVADYNNNRVLFYTTPRTTDGSADQVWGQGGSFTLSGCNSGGASATSLCSPDGVALDGANDLYVADYSNSRVLEFTQAANPPSNRTPNLVFGQLSTTTFSGCNQGAPAPVNATKLCSPAGLALDSANDLFVFDSGNNRVLEYFTPLSATGGGTGDATADVVLGQTDLTHNAANGVDADSFYRPLQAALDKSVMPNRLYLADENNNRILGWRDAAGFTTGAPADLVIGQPDFQTASCYSGGLTGGSVCGPTGVATDASGNLYVADFNNNRVLEFTNPFATCGSFPCVFGGTANKIFGQTSATVNGCNAGGITASSLCNPARLAIDGVGNLYVGDQSNHRVLEYNTPLAATSVTGSGDTVADLVFGQGTTGQGAEFTTNGCNQGGLSDHSLCNPNGVATDSANNVYIADQSNNRVLEFDERTTATTAPTNVTANTVFGQLGNPTANFCNNTSLSADSLCGPTALNLDSANNLYVGDQSNDRVLEYVTPLTVTATSGSGDTSADLVWGQGGSFLSNGCNLGGTRPSAATLCHAEDAVIDAAGRVFITDRDNNRLLRFDPPFAPPGFLRASRVRTGTLSVRPTTLAFRPTAVGERSRPKKVTIQNEGDTPLRVSDISTGSDEFVVGGTCGSAVPAGGTCTVTVTFTPLSTGHRGAQLLITHDALNSPRAIKLRGGGTRRGHPR
jgi:NHL repeat-containing protein/ASPM-SPD-2-Hydin domain-containing protein